MPITYEPIATTTASGSVSSITFSTISGSYTDLVIIVNGGTAGSDNSMLVRFNSDTGGNYSYTAIDGNGSSATSFRESNTSEPQAGSLSTGNNTSLINIMNYSNTTTYKTYVARGNAPAHRVRAFVGLWRNTAAITSVTIFNNAASNFTNVTTFTLYGIKAA
jgi:hypothetical protein